MTDVPNRHVDSLPHDALSPASGSAWTKLLDRHRWIPFVVPMAVFLAFTALEPKTNPLHGTKPREHTQLATRQPPPETVPASQVAASQHTLSYPAVYTIKIVVTLLTVVCVAPVYRSTFRPLHPLAVPVGIVGTFLWIAFAKLDLVPHILAAVGLTQWADLGARSAFNPLTAFAHSNWQLVTFLAIRFFGLVLLVPLIEEFFVRGFLMRFFARPDWWNVKLGEVTLFSATIATAYGMLAHPGELLAAAIWFTGITVLYARTRNIWDCVAAHAITNLLLGVYVLVWHDWYLW